MTALARELQSRNHDVVLLSLPDTEPFVRNVARLPFIPCCEKEFPAGSTPEVVRQMSRLQGAGGSGICRTDLLGHYECPA